MNKCLLCGACKQLYRMGFAGMWDAKAYYCEVLNKIIDSETECKFWRPKQTDVDLSAERLDAAIEDIKFILSRIKDE